MTPHSNSPPKSPSLLQDPELLQHLLHFTTSSAHNSRTVSAASSTKTSPYLRSELFDHHVANHPHQTTRQTHPRGLAIFSGPSPLFPSNSSGTPVNNNLSPSVFSEKSLNYSLSSPFPLDPPSTSPTAGAKAESASVSTSSVTILPPTTTILFPRRSNFDTIPKMPRRPSLFTIVGAGLACLIFFYVVFPSSSSSSHDAVAHSLGSKIVSGEKIKAGVARTPAQLTSVEDYDPIDALGKSEGPSQDLIAGAPIMGHMTNETIRAEVGRAGWKLFHTILAKYPVNPTPNDRETLSSYIYLFSRVYPCGQCAEHFQALLRQYPPQTSSREAASQWGCFVHNQVNERLGKEIFDCSTISDKYACGCAEDDEQDAAARAAKDASLGEEKGKDTTSKRDTTSGESAGGVGADETGEVVLAHEGNEVLKDLKLEVSKSKEKDSPLVLEKGG